MSQQQHDFVIDDPRYGLRASTPIEGELRCRHGKENVGLALKGEHRAGLTDAEFDVLQRVLAGRSNAEIAQERASSKRTVANQIATMFKKLGVRSRRELVASRHGEMMIRSANATALTAREQTVLAFVSQGCSDKTIASHLGCSTSAVGALLTRARRKQREKPAFDD